MITPQHRTHQHYAPAVQWDVKVSKYLSASFGPNLLDEISVALTQPPLRPTLRANTLRVSTQELASQLSTILRDRFSVKEHSRLPATVTVQGRGPLQPDYTQPNMHEVVVNRYAAEAVLKGADVYVPGVLAASAGLPAGALARVSVALELPGRSWCGINRGSVINPGQDASLPDRSHLYIGLGRSILGRRQLFREQNGLALQMVDRVFDIPPLNGVLRGQAMLQALPCILAAHVLNPQPGALVLDMCAAPGGKTTMLAQLMQDRGTVVALDRTHSKVVEINSLAQDLGLTCVCAYKADATQVVAESSTWQSHQICNQQQTQPDALHADSDIGDYASADSSHSHQEVQQDPVKFQPESFDYIMLDPPCSALGLRPRLLHNWSLRQLQDMASYQRKLIDAAVSLLKPGGSLVYCTCTINPAENEGNVRYALDRFPCLALVPSEPVLGEKGLIGADPVTSEAWLTHAESELVQRFNPGQGSEDTIGFFIAKFVKTKSSA